MQEPGVKNDDGADGWWHCRVQFSESRVDFQIRKPAQKHPEILKCQECGHISCLFGPFKQHYGKYRFKWALDHKQQWRIRGSQSERFSDDSANSSETVQRSWFLIWTVGTRWTIAEPELSWSASGGASPLVQVSVLCPLFHNSPIN